MSPAGGPSGDQAPPPGADGLEEILYRNALVRIVRVRDPDGGSVIRKEVLGPNGLARTNHEAAILERLAGIPGVPPLLRVPNGTSLIFDDEQGTTLAELIAAVGPEPAAALELTELLAVAIGLAVLLAQVHRRGVILKDINPVNVLLRAGDRRPMLVDFDLASTFLDERPSFTHASAIVGTLAYLAPEQTGRTGQGVDHRSDLYSLGITLYELCTGSTPFGRGKDDALTLIHDHLARIPTPANERNPALPAALSEIIATLLEKEPDLRYQSANGLAHDLRRVREQLTADTAAPFRLGERDFPLRLTAPSRLIAREEQTAALAAAFDRAAAGPARGILLAGPTGVGKTALIDQLRPIVTAGGGWFVTGKFEQRGQDQSKSGMSQALRGLARLMLAEPEARLAAHRANLLAALGDKAPLIGAVLPEFAALLQVAPEQPTGDRVQAQVRLRQGALEILRLTASAERPVVMVLDDLQWATSFPLGVADAALTEGVVSGLLIVGAYREGTVHDTSLLAAMAARWEQLGVLAPLVRLTNLSPNDLGLMLREMLRLDPAEAARLALAIADRTNGNPYETVELLNALRTEEALILGGGSTGSTGWTWDAETIRRHVGEGDVGTAQLAARIARLPVTSLATLQVMSCLDGQIDLAVLEAATALGPAVLRERLVPAVEDGLVVLTTAGDLAGETVRFRHDRVQQTTRDRLDPAASQELHLRIARRLAGSPGHTAVAAEQYLTALDDVTDPVERRRVADLLHRAAIVVRVTNTAAAERFLAVALEIISSEPVSTDAPASETADLLLTLQIERHAALFSLGQFADSDELYESIERQSPGPLDLAASAGVQITCLTNRERPQEAIELGLRLLGRLGLVVPFGAELNQEIDRGLEELYRWAEADDQSGDLARPEVADATVNATAEIINRMMPPAYFCDQGVMAWLVLQSYRLWAEHGPCRALVSPLAHAAAVTVAFREDYRTGYRVTKRVLAISGRRGYEPETSHARFLFSAGSAHWFEPLEDGLDQARQAGEGLLRGGDQQTAVFTYHALTPSQLDFATTLESYLPTVEAGLALAARAGNEQTVAAALPYRQLVRALRGETTPAHTFTDETFSETAHLAGLTANPMAKGDFHVARALAAALFGDHTELAAQAAAAMPLLPYLRGLYTTSRAYLLRALALAWAAHTAGPDERPAVLDELNACRDWLASRAADAPGNFGHLLALVDAERAWALGDFRGSMAGFDAAMQEAGDRRPWHRALITERAATFHLAHGHEHAARTLLAVARDGYAEWGASAKVEQLQQMHPYLRTTRVGVSEPGRGGGNLVGVSSDTVDLLAVLKASQALGSETEFGRLRSRVVEVLTTMTGATTVRVLLWSEDDGGWVLPSILSKQPNVEHAAIGVEAAGAAGLLPLSAFRYAERTGEPLLVADATRDDRFSADPYLAQVRCCSLLMVPIRSRGALRVMLMLENRLHRDVFSTDRLDAIMLIAGQLAVSFENAMTQSLREQEADRRLRLLDTLQRRERLLETLLAIQRDISHRAPLQTVLDAVTTGASAMLDGDFVALVLVDPLGARQPQIPSVCGRRSARDRNELVLTLAAEAIAGDRLVTRPDELAVSLGGLIAVPVHASGEIIGSLVTAHDEADTGPERQELLSAFAEQVSLALNDANTLEAIREAAYDSLTGLASRPLFLDRLKQALEAGAAVGAEVSVLFIDLDRFKAVNDSLGHGAGDELLAAVAGRLRECIREADVAARLGGDEFAVLLEGTHGAAAGLNAAERITTALLRPFRIAGKDIFATASVGVAHGIAADHAAASLLGQADLAMYRAKKAGAHRAVVFEPQMHAEARERLDLQGDLQRALAAGEFRLQFQPLLALTSAAPESLSAEGQARPVGVEALLRWQHPTRGMISPDVFIPLAEETGAIVELGRWVLAESCRQVSAWRGAGWPDLELSINVSGRQLLDGRLALDLAEILAETGLPARALTLELTETVLLDESGSILLRLSELKRQGVQLAIDDFGTGYSSLSYLRRFPVDKLKIDKAFIDNIADVDEDLAIVRTVLDLARILQLQTTAEGIETPEQLHLLRELGCEVGQGYLFARPLDALAIPHYLASNSWATIRKSSSADVPSAGIGCTQT